MQNYDESSQALGDPVLTGYAPQSGIQAHWYSYDAMNRLSSVATGAYGQVQTGTDAGGVRRSTPSSRSARLRRSSSISGSTTPAAG